MRFPDDDSTVAVANTFASLIGNPGENPRIIGLTADGTAVNHLLPTGSITSTPLMVNRFGVHQLIFDHQQDSTTLVTVAGQDRRGRPAQRRGSRDLPTPHAHRRRDGVSPEFDDRCVLRRRHTAGPRHRDDLTVAHSPTRARQHLMRPLHALREARIRRCGAISRSPGGTGIQLLFRRTDRTPRANPVRFRTTPLPVVESARSPLANFA